MTMKTKIKNELHSLAIRKGWYKDVTTELPLNVCRTVFGVYFFEGSYTPERPEAIFEHLYTWGVRDGCYAMRFKPRVGEWKIRKDGLARYRRVSVQREGWTTESEPLGLPSDGFEVPMEDRACRGPSYDEDIASEYWERAGNAAPLT